MIQKVEQKETNKNLNNNNLNNFPKFSIKEWIDRAGKFEIKNDKGQLLHFSIKVVKDQLYRCSKSGSIYLNYICEENGINILLRISNHEQKKKNYMNMLMSKNLTIGITLFFWELRKMNTDKAINRMMASKFSYEFSMLAKTLKNEYKELTSTWKRLNKKFKYSNEFFNSKNFEFVIKKQIDENFQKFSFKEIKKNILEYDLKKMDSEKNE